MTTSVNKRALLRKIIFVVAYLNELNYKYFYFDYLNDISYKYFYFSSLIQELDFMQG